MRSPCLALFCILVGCHVHGATEPKGRSSDWTWSEWSTALLRGAVPSELPPIPVTGWRCNGVSWFRDGAQVADYNADGRVDYIRIVDPPDSYNHLIWVDSDHDGFFDRYPGTHEESGQPDPQFKVPLFELANKPMQRAGSAGR